MPAPRFVVPFGREGAADRAARAFAASSAVALAIENLPGGGGLPGVRRANALCDAGEPVLLLSTPTTHILLPARLGREAAPRAALAPVLGLGFAPNVLLVSPRLGVASVEALLERARVERLVYASAGTGQTIHVCTALLCAQAGVTMEHRPYDGGSATAYEDLAAGRVHVYFDNLLGCRERIAQGEAIALAVSAKRRHAALPDVPTLAERGFEGHALDVWLGVFGAHLDAETRRAVDDAAADEPLRARLVALGLWPGQIAGEAFGAWVADSMAPWTEAIRTAAW